MSIAKLITFVLLFFSTSVFSYSGYLKITALTTDKQWDFLPTIPQSFDSAQTNTLEAFLIHESYGFLISTSQFELDVVRSSEPKSLNLTANKNKYEFFYLPNPQSAFSIAFKQQTADRQFIDCYSFGSLVIGSCPNASLKLTNSRDEFKELNNSLIFIDGQNRALQLNYRRAFSNLFADEVGLGIEITDMQYFWLTPLENIQSPLIQNLNVSGRKLGDIIALELSRLPQRESWKSYQLNLNVLKSYQLSQSLSVFYDFDYISIDHSKYRALSDIPNSNIKFRSGLKYDFGKMQLSIFGDFYKNNLLGFEPIIVNQRTENYFTQNFGSLGAEILVRF